jgi:hypothetical protein
VNSVGAQGIRPPKSALATVEGAVVLEARDAQAGEAMAVDKTLPGKEFFHGERVTCASLFEAEEAGSDGGNDFRLAADDPALGLGRGEAVEADARSDVEEPLRALGFPGLRLSGALGCGRFGLHDEGMYPYPF